jgi:SpoVK/Ycf46/Vps4 family AAA+-type ATPase
MQKGLLKLREGFFKSDREVLLTEKALDDLFGEDKDFIQSAQNRSNRELISCESIGESRLFFNNEEQKKLDFVTSLLHETRYRTTVRRLEKMNMRPGISILFHGVPGTGKTASAHEIARRTGRDLFVVDISRTKSMWFGESEKIIKELFENYARLVKNSRKAPVLLFNEADAVFSTRKAVSHSSVAQTENTIQNIILQEMENLNGIMIATTNLTQNLDRAFERRFLFKIAFRRPDEATRLRILRDKLPNLAMEEVMLIARQFDLSGGNIDNISRKTEMHKVLKGKYPDLPALIEFCHEETMDMAGGRKIGFC